MTKRIKSSPPMWPSLIAYPLVFITSPITVPLLMLIHRIRKG